MNKTQKSCLLLRSGILVLALIAAGCQSSKKPEGPPDGKYSRKDFLITIDQGRFSIAGDPGEDMCEQGSYTFEGDKITFNTEKFNASCESVCGKHPVYSYQWAFDAAGKQLTFKSDDDLCALRRGDFTSSPLTYSQLSQ